MRSIAEFGEVFDYVVGKYSNPAAWDFLRRALHGEGVEADVKNTMSYVGWMRQGYAVFVVRRHKLRAAQSPFTPRKIYAVDPDIALRGGLIHVQETRISQRF